MTSTSYDPTLTSSTKNAPLRSSSAAYQASVVNAEDEGDTVEGHVSLKDLESFHPDEFSLDNPSNILHGTIIPDQPVMFDSPPALDNETVDPIQPGPKHYVQDERIQSQDPSRGNSKRSIDTVNTVNEEDVIYLYTNLKQPDDTDNSAGERASNKRRKSVANISDSQYHDEVNNANSDDDTYEADKEDIKDPISEMKRITKQLKEDEKWLDRNEPRMRRLTKKTIKLANSMDRSYSFNL